MYYIAEVGSFSYSKPTKKINEDFLLLPTYDLDANIVFGIADGVGSSEYADRISKSVINATNQLLQKENFSIENALNNAKSTIKKLASVNEKYVEAATAFTLVQIQKDNIIIGHIGDCRVYVKKQNKLIQLTKDHTRYQELVDEGELSIKKLKQHRERLSSILTKALTSSFELKFDLIKIPVHTLMSDGTLIMSLMSDGAHSHWQSRPKFSENTMNSPLAFTSSLYKRVRKSPKDDFTCLTLKVEQEFICD